MTEEILERVKVIGNKQTKLHDTVLICQKAVNDHGRLLDTLSKAISNVYDQIMEVSKEVSIMKSNFSTFEYDLNLLEQLSLRSTLEIHGIPYRQNESALSIVANVCRVLEAKVGEGDVDFAYRITLNGPADTSRVAPIVVGFSRSLNADRVIKAKKLKRNVNTDDLGMQDCSPTPLYINYRLTRMNRKIFTRAWNLKKEGLIKYVWMRHGKMFARIGEDTERVHLRNIFDVDVLSAKAEIRD